MKRLILSIILVVFTAGLFAQSTDGTGTGWKDERRKQNFKDSVYFNISPVFKADQFIDSDEYYVQLTPDTVQQTDHYTVAASDWPKEQHCLKATSIAITFPADLTDWPVGGWMHFYQAGDGIMVFKAAAGVTLVTPLDSVATTNKGDWVSWKKLAANKYTGVGNLLN